MDLFEATLEKRASHHLKGAPSLLSDAILYSLLAPGKRIRPRFVYGMAELFGHPPEQFDSVACSIEMYHCFSLIHDDLPCMDDDDFRRGLPANHKKFGESIALLAGDALLNMASAEFSTMTDQVAAGDISFEAFRNAEKLIHSLFGPAGVIGGQIQEMTLNENSAQEDLIQMHAAKTGALFRAAILVPMALNGISNSSPDGEKLTRFSEAIGFGFQVSDDLEDHKQDQSNSGEMLPINILSYMSAQEAIMKVETYIEQSNSELFERWGPRSKTLTDLASLILNRVKFLEI